MIAAVVRTAPSSYFPAYYYLKEGLGTSIALQQPNGGTVGYTHGITELSVSVSTAAAKWYAVTLRGPAMELQVGPGSSSGPASSANVDNPGAWTFVCKAGIAFEIAELIVVKGHVTDTDYDKTRQYLDDKYGL